MASIDKENLSPILRDFRDEKLAQLAESSVKEYLYALKEFEIFLKKQRKKTLDRMTKKDLTAFVIQMQERELKSNTIQRKLVTIRQFTQFLWEDDKLPDKSYKAIQSFSVRLEKDNEERRALLPEDVKLCLKNITNPMWWTVFWVGINYGLRCKEYASLQLGDLDLKKRILTIRLSKGNKTRRIRILKDHVRVWQNWLKIRESYHVPHDFVFFSSRGKVSERVIQRYFNQMSESVFGDSEKARGNKWFTAHTLRYTYATNLWRKGLDLFIVSKLLGHASIQTTEKYLKVQEEEIHEKYEQWAKTALESA